MSLSKIYKKSKVYTKKSVVDYFMNDPDSNDSDIDLGEDYKSDFAEDSDADPNFDSLSDNSEEGDNTICELPSVSPHVHVPRNDQSDEPMSTIEDSEVS